MGITPLNEMGLIGGTHNVRGGGSVVAAVGGGALAVGVGRSC